MFNFFRSFFGPPGSDETTKNFNRREHFVKDEEDTFSSRSFFNDHDDHMGFNVFTNPLEMHRYFESQLNSMLKTFGLPNEDMFFGFNENGPDPFSNFLEAPEHPAPPGGGDLRDQFLKPGYQHPHSETKEKSDSDIDGKVNSADLDSMFNGKMQQLQPYEQQPKFHMFGKQIMTKTFTNHNGIVQSQQTVRDHEGNEETVVTHKRGDQEYRKVTRTGKDGLQEIKENFVNMSEDDLSKFFGGDLVRDSPSIPERNPNWFPFDKYFK